MIPNTTQVPHVLIRKWLPTLSSAAVRMVFVIVDATFGWASETRYKRKDWLSRSQIMLRGGIKSSSAFAKAAHELIDIRKIVEAVNSDGQYLNNPIKRKKNGSKIFYRLNLK